MSMHRLHVGLALAAILLGGRNASAYSPDGKAVASGGTAAEQDAAPDIKKLARARVTAARKTCEMARKLLDEGLPGARPEDVYTWSVRWLRAQQHLSHRPADDVAALREHLTRMKDLAKRVDRLVKAGRLPPLAAPAAAFYVAEAEFWLAAAQDTARKEET